MVIFLYNLDTFIWIQHGCLPNTVFTLDPSNHFIKRLCCNLIWAASREKVPLNMHKCRPRSSSSWAAGWSLPKHAYSNIMKISPPKNENFQIKNSDVFHVSAQNTDCGYSLELPQWGSSNEYQSHYPQSMFLSRNMKNNVYPCKPEFYYIKVGFKGVKII